MGAVPAVAFSRVRWCGWKGLLESSTDRCHILGETPRIEEVDQLLILEALGNQAGGHQAGDGLKRLTGTIR